MYKYTHTRPRLAENASAVDVDERRRAVAHEDAKIVIIGA